MTTLSLFAQNTKKLNCGTIITSNAYNSIKPQLKHYEQEYFSEKYSKTSTAIKAPNSIPIKAHIIRNSNGSGGLEISELNAAINNLNRIYANAFLEFYLCDGVNYINNDLLNQFNKGEEISNIETYFVPGLINIYFTDTIKNDFNEDICGFSNNTNRKDIVIINNHCATNNSSLAHELGHFFSLMHTHGPDNQETTSELVNGSNCDTDGDGICDTPADPGLTNTNVNNFCQYTGLKVDANGEHYQPNPKNIMSYSRKSCRSSFSEQQLARIYAFYMTTKSYLTCYELDASFIADKQSTCKSTLTVNFKSTSEHATHWEWDINADGITDYFTKNITHTFKKGIYNISLKVSNEIRSVTKIFNNFIKVGTDTEVLLYEDFENFNVTQNHGWSSFETSNNDYHWYVNVGDTESDGTGPSNYFHENQKPNTYIYAEASGANPGDIAAFITPCIHIDYENSALDFSYHMFGENEGELHVDIITENNHLNDVIPALIGSQQSKSDDSFLTKTIDLSAYTNQTIKVRFRAVRGSSWDSDIAIDNIFIKTIHTAISSRENSYNVFPNPIKDNLLYIDNGTTNNHPTYIISSLSGQVFLSGTLSNQPINMEYLASGAYLLTILDNQKKVVKKIIK